MAQNSGKESRYYNFDKARIASRIPKGAHRVLDVGCAAGRLGQRLREEGRATELVGVEVFAEPARQAAAIYDRVFVEDIETFSLPYADYFDYVVCGDVLEHLRDPWAVSRRLCAVLRPGGLLLASEPNVRYWRVIRDLVIYGRWEYVEAGIMDNTHLRFFTRASFESLLHGAGLHVEGCEFWIGGPKQKLASRMALGALDEFLAGQFMVMARRQS